MLDFVDDPEGSRKTINKWIGEQTENCIQDLVQPGLINQSTRMILTNAINFNAAWQHPFEDSITQRHKFYLLNGDIVRVLMMRQKEGFRYSSGDGYQAIELPYSGSELSMVIVLPELEAFEIFEADLESS